MTGLHHPFLDPHRSWSAIGDATLFASPFLFHVRLTLKKTVEEHQAAIDEIVEKAHAFRQNCLAMNDLAATLCAAANTGETQ